MRINFWGDFVLPPPLICKYLSISMALKQLLDSADINIVNYEAPSWDSRNSLPVPISKSGPSLHQDIKAPEWLEKNGFTLASLANNHIFDYGDIGYESTVSSFNSIRLFGAGTWEEAYRPCIVEVGGQTVAFLSLSHCEFGTLTDRWDKRYIQGTAWINHPEVDKIIMETRKRVDLLFIFAHAGMENISQPLPEWRDRYRSFIDIGCDGVIASHPHVAQGWETYRGKPIVYSLGNFYFPKPTKKQDSWYRSLCASIISDNEGIHLEMTPIVFNDAHIDIDTSEEFKRYLEDVNKVLSNEGLYIKEVNEICIRLLDEHYRLFEAGGLLRYNPYKLLKITAKKILGKESSDTVHLINNLWCESHRFLICRALKLIDNIR